MAALTIEDGGHTDSTTTVWISGGNEATRYILFNIVATSGGRAGQRTLEVKITGHPNHRFARLTGHGALTAAVGA